MFRIRTLLLASLGCAALSVHAQQGGDLEAQILYAFHAEDTNQLTALVQTLSTREQAGGADSALRYDLAHAQYRVGLLAGERHARAAQSAFEACTAQLKIVLERNPDSVESLALASACDANLARLKKLESVFFRARAADRLSIASKLEPRNPRVLYLTALDGFARSAPGSDEYARAFAQLRLAAQLFEQTSATRVDAPGWGHADAYLDMGRQLQSRGDFLGARNWIEKALIAAPDYKAAQRQLALLVNR